MRGAIRVILPIACSLTAASAAAMVPPSNDICGQNSATFAVPATGGTRIGTLFEATRDGIACAGAFGVDVYYYFVPAVPGPWQVSLCSTPINLAYDTVLSIHTNVCPVSRETYITPADAFASCNDDGVGCTSGLSQIPPLLLVPGTPLIIRVATLGQPPPAPRNFTLTVVNTASSGACCGSGGVCTVRSISLCEAPLVFQGEGTACSPNPCPQPPVNDTCAAAIVLSGSSADVLGTTSLAGTDGASTCAAASRDVWYAFIPDSTAGYSISLCGSSTVWPSLLSVHSGCPGNAASQIAGACDDDGCSASTPGSHALILAATLQAGAPYLIRVAGEGSAGASAGAFRLTIGAALGACCRAADASCIVTPQSMCPSPDLWMPGSICAPTKCAPLLGACCNPASGVCSVTTAIGCAAPGVFLGTMIPCSPSPCPQPVPGACCDATGCCTVTIEPMCGGTFVPAAACAPTLCGATAINSRCESAIDIALASGYVGNSCLAEPSTGDPAPMCVGVGGQLPRSLWLRFTPPATAAYAIWMCGSDHDTVLTAFSGTCGLLSEVGCNDDAQPPCEFGVPGASVLGPIVLQAGVPYLLRAGDSPVVQVGGVIVVSVSVEAALGACCAPDGSCAPTDAANCPAGSTFTPGGACDPNPCPPPLGACCTGSICTQTTQAACAGPASAFAGVGLACNQYPQSVGACCLADFNHLSGVSVQDLFDFLSAYFSGLPDADINRTGLISVEDIFNYLDAYFRGGC